MASQQRLPPHIWVASPCCFVLGLMGLYHGVILRGLCVFLIGLGGLILIFRRNARGFGAPDKVALACYGLGVLLLIAIVIERFSTGGQ